MALKQFKTESVRLLDLMINSIYTNKEIFLRELISNASDAIDNLYFLSLTDENVATGKKAFRIAIEVDKAAGTLTVSDNGIGMNKEELEENLGTIAKSGSLDFKLANQSEELDIIGQFGVGFYASFMVADKVTVKSRAYGEDTAYQWESAGGEGYSVTPCEKADVGTTITLHIKPDTETERYSEFLETFRLSSIVKKYSDYIRYPIEMDVEKTRRKPGDENEVETYTETETLNSMIPLWKRDKKDVKKEEYTAFFHNKFGGFGLPARVITSKTEGTASYHALLYIPTEAPYNYYTNDYKKGLQLYASGVLIMENCPDLLPDYFAFVKGLVDSQDLSLNISREMLQQDSQLQLIKNALEKKIKSELLNLLETEREVYENFYENFGAQLKMGCYIDYGMHKLLLQDLLLFYSAKQAKPVTLAEYAAAMPEGQKYIYYAAGESNERLAKLPSAERVLEKGYDLLYLTNNTDEFVLQMISVFKEYEFRNISSGDLGLETEAETAKLETMNSENKPLFDAMEKALNGKIKTVRLTQQLKNHPVCLRSEGPLSIEMEKVLNSIPGQEKMNGDKALEINADHAVFATLQNLFAKNDNEKLALYTNILFTPALLIEGLPVDDPVAFASAVCSIMEEAAN